MPQPKNDLSRSLVALDQHRTLIAVVELPIPPNTLAELTREMAQLRFINDQIKQIEAARLERVKQSPQQGPNSKVLQLARIRGVGLETADMLVHACLFPMRDLVLQTA